MKAIKVYQQGNPEVLQLEEVEIGKPGDGQALIRNHFAGVNFIDIYFRKGIYPIQTPYIPGLEGSGIVEEVGKGVSLFKPGDR